MKATVQVKFARLQNREPALMVNLLDEKGSPARGQIWADSVQFSGPVSVVQRGGRAWVEAPAEGLRATAGGEIVLKVQDGVVSVNAG